MVGHIARKEMREMLRDGRFQVAAAVIAVLLLASLGAGWKEYATLRRQHDLAQQSERRGWLAQGPKNPHQAAHYGVYAFKPTTQLSVLDTGVAPYLGVAVYLEAHKQNEAMFRPAQDAATSSQRFGELTAAVVLQLLIPLLIVLLTFGTFAGEREQGTLRQVLSLGVRPGQLAAGKALGVVGALSLVIVPAASLGVLALTLTSSRGLMAGDLGRTVLLLATYLVYFGIFIGISLGVSGWARSSRLALVVLTTFWIGNSLVATRGLSDLVGHVRPTPSEVAFNSSLQQDLADTATLDRTLEARRRELLNQYQVKSVADLPINFSAVSLQESENHGYTVFERHFGRLFDQFEQQNVIYQWGALLAPLVATRSLSMGLAGTDFAHYRHFTDAAENYRRVIVRTMNDDILAHPVAAGGEYRAGTDLWEKVPEFTYQMPSAGWVLRHYVPSVAVLALWLLAAVAMTSSVTRRLWV